MQSKSCTYLDGGNTGHPYPAGADPDHRGAKGRNMKKIEEKKLRKKLDDNNKLLIENIAKARADIDAKEQKILQSKAAPQILDALNRRIKIDVANLEAIVNMKMEWRGNFHTALIEEAQKLTAEKFESGRKPGAVGPIRKRIEALLKKSPDMKNAELWNTIAAKPPKGWELTESARIGKYATGPNMQNMDYPRFRNVAWEVRKALKA